MSLILIFAYISAAVLFFLLEYFHVYAKLKIPRSFIAGVSLAYFFLVVLPEVGENIPELPLHLKNFEYFYVLLGFSFHHTMEKLILQNVQKESIIMAKELVSKEEKLQLVENSLEQTVETELMIDKTDNCDLMIPIKEIASTIRELKNESKKIASEIKKQREKISQTLSLSIEKFKTGIRFMYHFLIGILIVGVSSFNLFSGEVIVLFGILMTTFTYKQEIKEVYRDLQITLEFHETSVMRIILSISTPIGILIGLILQATNALPLETIYIVFSLVMGSITYSFMRDVIPEDEEGKPLLFLIGLIVMSAVVLLFSYLLVLFSEG